MTTERRGLNVGPAALRSLLRTPGLALAAIALASTASLASVDCTGTECQRFVAKNGGYLEGFGRDVAVSGNLAVVSADADDDHGAVYAYERLASGWEGIQTIVPTDIAFIDRFGASVAMVGNTLVVGSPGDDDRGLGSGSVYVFEFDGALWQRVQKLTASDGQASDSFGWSVAIAEDVIAVGAIDEDAQGNDAGAVYVFRDDGQQWVEEQKLQVSTPGPTDEFGFSVATDGEVVVGGAVNYDGIVPDMGAVYVFRYDGAAWMEEQALVVDDGGANDWFGWSVAVEGELLVVGANNHDQPVNDIGAVYVFRHNGTSWVDAGKITPAPATGSQRFGWSVALDGRRLVVGALAAVSAGGITGAVYAFYDDGAAWVQTHRWTSSVPTEGMFFDNLGASVAIDGRWVFGGASFAGGAVENDAGSASAFNLIDLNCDGSVDVSELIVVLNGWGTPAGDVTGDGTTDVTDLLAVLSAWGSCP